MTLLYAARCRGAGSGISAYRLLTLYRNLCNNKGAHMNEYYNTIEKFTENCWYTNKFIEMCSFTQLKLYNTVMLHL